MSCNLGIPVTELGDYYFISYNSEDAERVSSIVQIMNKLHIPIISSMGTGNKLDPTRLEVTDIYKTSICPLAKVMRKELKQRNIKKLKVVYSKEEPIKLGTNPQETTSKKQTPGSISFVPSVAGLIMAGEVIKDIIEQSKEKLRR